MNFMISIAGWFLWNWAEFTVDKAKYDDDGDDKTRLPIRKYIDTHWPTWIGSLVMIPVLLWIGARQLSLEPLAPILGAGVPLGWNDLYLLAAGAGWEGFIYGLKAIKNFFKKKTV